MLRHDLALTASLKRPTRGNMTNYRNYYSEETEKRIVAGVYSTDIDLLGYTFDNSSLPDQLASRSPVKT